jgi:MFS family permease
MVGSVAAAAIGWLILPTDVGFLAMRGWRLYFLVCVVPAILCCALVSIFLVESPCFLIRKNQFSKAARSLEVIAETNGQNMSLLRELTQQLHASQGIEDDKKGKGERTAQEQKPSSWKDDILQLLLEKEYRKTTMVLGIIWFCLSACWYGFMIWLPQFLQAKHDHVYLGNLITSAADLPGDFISFLLIEKIGRKKTLLISLVSAALLPLFFAAAPKGSPVWAILGSACFGFVSVGGWNALSILSPELFDTSVRATMHGFLTALGRVGGFIGTYFVGHFAHAGIWLPCIFATGILLLGCVATLFVPETSGKVITDYQVLKSPTTSSKASDP